MIRIRSKFTGLATLALATLSLTACFGTDSTDSAITLTETSLDVTSLPNDGSTKTSIRGKIASDVSGITVAYAVLDSVGDDVSNEFTISTTAPGASETSWSLGDPAKGAGTITAGKTAIAGTHSLKITVKNSAGTSATASVAFVVTKSAAAVSTPLTVAAQGLAVGGKSASAGSFISVSNATVYKTADLTTNRTGVDLIATADASGNAIMESSALAVTNGDATDAAWGTGNATIIAQVTSAPVDLEHAKSALEGVTTQSALINVAGASYVVKTAAGVYAVLTVTNVVGGGDAVTFTLTILK